MKWKNHPTLVLGPVFFSRNLILIFKKPDSILVHFLLTRTNDSYQLNACVYPTRRPIEGWGILHSHLANASLRTVYQDEVLFQVFLIPHCLFSTGCCCWFWWWVHSETWIQVWLQVSKIQWIFKTRTFGYERFFRYNIFSYYNKCSIHNMVINILSYWRWERRTLHCSLGRFLETGT